VSESGSHNRSEAKRTPSSSALKGRDNSAQGNALGKESKRIQALKGRDNGAASNGSPLQGWSSVPQSPRALPWAAIAQAFGLKGRTAQGTVRTPSSSAPKGRDNSAQGNALGKESKRIQAMKGRDNGAVSDGSPLQGWSSVPQTPRALPWAAIAQAFGLKGRTAQGTVRTPSSSAPKGRDNGWAAETTTPSQGVALGWDGPRPWRSARGLSETDDTQHWAKPDRAAAAGESTR